MKHTNHTQDNLAGHRRAVLYLRVSSAGQVNTDYDPEGLSIPAQRRACERRAEQMGDVEIVGEYVEPGRTGTNIEGRPAFQAMVQRLKDDGDVDLVIVYKVSRLNRDWIQAAATIDKIRKRGANLVSATENIDDTPAGQLTLGLLSAVNAFRSAEDGADIKYKLGEKVKRGGTIGLVPLGYRNERENFEGRKVATVVVDPERAPLVRQAFELFATGEFTVKQLATEMAARGLRTRPGKHPARPVSPQTLRRILTNRYYLGVVMYHGEEYDGRHEALVSEDLFTRTQAVIDARSTADERQRTHHHYLKGSLWCHACHQRGKPGRLVLTLANGRNAHYPYFFCRLRQEHRCDVPFLSVDDVEEAVAQHWATLRFPADLIEQVTAQVRSILADDQAATRMLRDQITAQLARLDVREENLLDLAAEGGVAASKIRQRLRDIEAERATLSASQDQATSQLAAGASVVTALLDLLRDPEALYRRSTDEGRRALNQAIFKRLRIEVQGVVDDELHEPFATFVSLGRQAATEVEPQNDSSPATAGLSGVWSEAFRPRRAGSIASAQSLNRHQMVEVMGFEPTASSMRPKRSSQLSYTPGGTATLSADPLVGRTTWAIRLISLFVIKMSLTASGLGSMAAHDAEPPPTLDPGGGPGSGPRARLRRLHVRRPDGGPDRDERRPVGQRPAGAADPRPAQRQGPGLGREAGPGRQAVALEPGGGRARLLAEPG